MYTLQQIMRESTDETLAWIAERRPIHPGLLSCPYFLPDIEQDLMQRMQVRILAANNAKCRGEAKIAMPRRLEHWQVAEILSGILDFRSLPPCPGSRSKRRRLAVPDGYGGWSADMLPVKRMALQLNSALTKGGLQKVLDRILLDAEEAPD